ncbi:putative bifunctional diguanylate cyclase/phosphodiesterase [Faunimonas sp. B44]|uniref:putative bifunctional diguanylate cyclase/phosphodiesterase n=1 Tax=Faunimonas sp. B44 TaxID=3461493 RepID=UPI0040450060
MGQFVGGGGHASAPDVHGRRWRDLLMIAGIAGSALWYGTEGAQLALYALIGISAGTGLRLWSRDEADRSSAAAAEERRVRNARLEEALDTMSEGLCMFDAEKRLIVCNTRYAELYRLSPELMQPGTPFRKIVESRIDSGLFAIGSPAEYIRERLAAVEEGVPSVKIQELTDGRTIAISHRPTPGGGWVATHDDITEMRRIEARIAHLAHHDALTGLPNRVRFREELDGALLRVRRGERIAVLCLDLDHFKAVNDTLGHPVGDGLLKAVAGRIEEKVRETDIIARLGGDEFAIVQVGLQTPDEASALAQRIITALSSPYEVDGHQVVIGTSIGIALAPADSEDADQLLKSADMALYRAKTDGRGVFRYFEPAMDSRMQARRALELDLRKALTNGEFEIHYQPLVNIETHTITAFEALLRWPHPKRGMVPVPDFIALAEEIGLIGQIGAWVLKEACCEAVKWPEDIRLAVNLSPCQFKNRPLVFDVMAALGQSGLAPSRLELEITETVMLQDTEATIATLHELRRLGVRISMDDFGTGYSSLSYLRTFPFDKIKIDRSFVQALPEDTSSSAIIRAVADLSAGLGMSATAEGVENEEQLARLRAEGCREVQGYLFSAARPASEIAGMLRNMPELSSRAA